VLHRNWGALLLAGMALTVSACSAAPVADRTPTPTLSALATTVASPSAQPTPEPSDGVPLYLAEANMGDDVGAGLPLGMLAGVKGVLSGNPVPADFAERLVASDPRVTLPDYGPQAYDAVVAAALAAAAARSDVGADIAAQLPAVTSGATECSDYASCVALLTSGETIAYRGVSGVSHLSGNGEPTSAQAGIYAFGPDNRLLPDVDYRDMTLVDTAPAPAIAVKPGVGADDGVLRFGLPALGDASTDFLEPTIAAGVRLAVADIEAAGGVPGFERVEVVPGPAASSSPSASGKAAKRSDPVADTLAAGPDVVVAPASGAGQAEIVAAATDAGVLVMAPVHADRSALPARTQGLLWSMEPGPTLPGALLGTVVAEDAHRSVAILSVANPYGDQMSKAVSAGVAAAGGTVVATVRYPEGADDLARQVAQVKHAKPDAIVLLGTGESAKVILELARQGVGPHATP
jgi:hypothetical protein